MTIGLLAFALAAVGTLHLFDGREALGRRR